MSHSGYIIDTALLTTMPPGVEWHASTFPADPSKSLVAVRWDNANLEAAFEGRPDVLALGRPWEPLPFVASALFGAPPPPVLGTTAAIPTTDAPLASETVQTALQKIEWPGARLVR